MVVAAIRFLLASDALVALALPLTILLICWRHIPWPTYTDIKDFILLGRRPKRVRASYFSLERAFRSYEQYAQLSAKEVGQMRRSYNTLTRANTNLGNKIGYSKKLGRLHDVTSMNAVITNAIVGLALEEFQELETVHLVDVGLADLGRVREALKHFIRDWSTEGEVERTRIFKPILELLKEVNEEERGNLKVLVPGCGLGRLAWEISELGFETTANELSFFMTLAFRFLLSPTTTTTPNEHSLRPYSHWFSHQRTNDSLFRRLPFPDVVPRLGPKLHLLEQDFLTIPAPPSLSWDKATPASASEGGYDYIVTLFFIDTSLDVFTTMRHIYNLLRPGGIWINLGPLLWTGGGQAKVELSLDEVLKAAEEIGFFISNETEGPTARRTVECEYTGDRNAMMRWIYRAEFWVGHKSKA
ncbi:hypothetical protein CVT24_008970 [Panaeolus cyanescens]|uniref:Uncharacterized protein n=1 Tax=Panaeolus cyanescens TaxID=181874 RepID=A0A409YAN2_9AGAR|nr:hypothetical protein CVT24_008970 [Panaeolus cyanescens]